MLTTEEIIKTWCTELLAPSDTDVLVTLSDGKNALLLADDAWKENETVNLNPSSQLKAILKKQKEFAKEAGVDSLGLSNYILEFELGNKTYKTPLLLVSVEARYNRINDTYILQQVDDAQINPFLSKLLGINDQLKDLEEIKEILCEIDLKSTLHEGVYLANFHPHRFVLLKDIERLLEQDKLAPSIDELLGGEQPTSSQPTNLHEGALFSYNEDQAAVFDQVSQNNCVIQGPPGTGKSQVIANLIGKSLGNNLKTLVVAEKPVALEVLFNKLKDVNLHHFCLMHHHQLKTSVFIDSLKNTWHYLETTAPKNKTYHQHSELLIQGLDLTLDRLRQPDLVGGIDFSTFKQITEKVDWKKAGYLSEIPNIPEWKNDRQKLSLLEEKGFPIFGSWRRIRAISDSDIYKNIEGTIDRALQLIADLQIEKSSYAEFKKQQRLAASAHLFFYNDIPINEELLTKKRVQSKFHKLYNNYSQNLEKEKLLLDEKKLWKDDFNLTQLLEYIAILTKNDRFSLRFWKTKKELARLSSLSMKDATAALQRLVDLKHVQEDIVKNKTELRELGLDTSIVVLEQIKLILLKLTTLDENNYKQLVSKTIKQRYELKESSSKTQEFNHLISTYFYFDKEAILHDELLKLRQETSLLVSNSKALSTLSNASRKVLLHTNSIDEADTLIYHSHWTNFQSQFPELAGLDNQILKERITTVIETQQQERSDFSAHIHSEIFQRFHAFHQLLQTPASKLNQEQKDLKKRLRKGKSILVKEFGKRRNLMSPLELLSSEASLWIDVLKPVILGSPYSIAKSIPFEANLFDLVIFDEASQIPLPHALGGIFRSSKVAVAGDEQQMAPSFFFKKGVTKSADLLHQVSYYWKNCHLKHHYRSVHPDLIAFSNRYFYDNKLLAYPKYGAEKPIHLITVDGVYTDRMNQKEAKLVAGIIEDKVENGLFNFGVVAFSQSQLKAIMNHLPSRTQQKLAEHESNELFFKSLEHVQGDECDHLIISLGYSYSEDGRFSMQFGPLNKVNGYRRLNVLMTRAKKEITFIRSVQSSDFSIAENDGVELLRKLMLHLENISNDDPALTFPYAFNYKQRKEELTVLAPQNYIHSALALVNLHEVLIQRGWKIDYSL